MVVSNITPQTSAWISADSGFLFGIDMSAIAENCVAIDGTWGRSFLFDCKMKDNWQQHIPRGVEMPTLPREPKTTITTTITPIDLGPAPTKPTSPHVSPTAILPRDGKTTVVDGHTTTVPWVTEVVHKLNVPGAGQVIDTRFYGKTLTFDGHTTTIDSFNTFEWVASVLSAEERTTIRSNTKPTIVLPRNDKTILTTRVSPKAMVFHNDKTTITTTFNTMDLSPATTKPQSPGNDKTTLATLPRPTPALADNDEATTFTQVSPTAIPPRKVKPTITTTVEVEVIDLGPATTKGQSPHTSPPTPTLPRDDKPTALPRPTPALPDFGDATMFTQDTPTAIRPRHNPFATAVELYPISWDPSRASPSPAGKGEGEDA
jgi:hypothetical protein